MRTCDQFASSSSASIIARDVCTPWPISAWGTIAVNVLSGDIFNQTSNSASPSEPTRPATWSERSPRRIATPKTTTPPAVTAVVMKARRVHLPIGLRLIPQCIDRARRPLDAFANARISTAAADVAGHREVDIGVARC